MYFEVWSLCHVIYHSHYFSCLVLLFFIAFVLLIMIIIIFHIFFHYTMVFVSKTSNLRWLVVPTAIIASIQVHKKSEFIRHETSCVVLASRALLTCYSSLFTVGLSSLHDPIHSPPKNLSCVL